MLDEQFALSEARSLTNLLRSHSEHSSPLHQYDVLEERPSTVQMVLEGGVLRQRHRPDGRVHTVAVYFRDDVINLNLYANGPGRITDRLVALEGTITGSVPFYAMSAMPAADKGEGFSQLLAREMGIAQEHLFSLGQRNAVEAMAHFFCETILRCSQAPYEIDQCRLPITNVMLSTVLGLSPVHVNRTLHALQNRSLASFDDQFLVVHDFNRLAQLANFDEGYLTPI